MTSFIWDTSHFDGPLSTATLARARDEGIVALTHKLAEGTTDTEGTSDDSALAAARAVGIEFLGGYLVPRTYTSVSAQVDFWLQVADRSEPWWRTFPGWFWQVDLERWSYDNVPASIGIACARELRARTGRWTILYASHGQYGDQLAGWDGPLWNADYVNTPRAGFAAMYPGDNWRPVHSFGPGGWGAYSGQEPTFLQYSSSATIAGLAARDVSAFRGSLDELRALITAYPNGAAAVDYSKNAEHYLWKLTTLQPDIANGELDGEAGAVHLDLVDAITEIRTAVKVLASGGVDLDALAAKLAPLVSAPVAELRAAVDALEGRLAKAAQDEAADLAAPQA